MFRLVKVAYLDTMTRRLLWKKMQKELILSYFFTKVQGRSNAANRINILKICSSTLDRQWLKVKVTL